MKVIMHNETEKAASPRAAFSVKMCFLFYIYCTQHSLTALRFIRPQKRAEGVFLFPFLRAVWHAGNEPPAGTVGVPPFFSYSNFF